MQTLSTGAVSLLVPLGKPQSIGGKKSCERVPAMTRLIRGAFDISRAHRDEFVVEAHVGHHP
eukprot:scaffold27596_cov27-Prasinocladus_malaysianus.AAC.1